MEREVALGSGTLCSILTLQLPGQLHDPGNILELNFPVHKAISYALPHLLLTRTLPIGQILSLMSLQWLLISFRIKPKVLAMASKAPEVIPSPTTSQTLSFPTLPFAPSVPVTLTSLSVPQTHQEDPCSRAFALTVFFAL